VLPVKQFDQALGKGEYMDKIAVHLYAYKPWYFGIFGWNKNQKCEPYSFSFVENICNFTVADFETQIGRDFPEGEAIGYIEVNGLPGYNEGDKIVSLDDAIGDGVRVHVMCYEW